MYFYNAEHRGFAAMSRKHQLHEPHAGKMRLLQKTLSLQRRKRDAALAAGDADEVESVDRRIFHVEKLLEEMESRR